MSTAGQVWPLDPATPVASGYGERWGVLHDGTDFACPAGTPIYATHYGMVTNPPEDVGGYGVWVMVQGAGWETHYGHLSVNGIYPTGTWVAPGTLIGYSGNTGGSTGPHLHLRVKHAGQSPGIDPIPWLADAAWPPPGPVEQQVHDWGRAAGLGQAGVAGIMGNFAAESLMDPGIVEGMGHDLADLVPGVREGVGLLQWSYERREALLAYAAARDLPWQDVALQLDFMASEIADGYGAMWAGLGLAADPRVASQLFAREFVRPGVYGARDDYAATYYQRILAGEFGNSAPEPPPSPPAPRRPILPPPALV